MSLSESSRKARTIRRREQQLLFLAAYHKTGIIRLASIESGTSQSHFKWLKADPAYAAEFAELKYEVTQLTIQNKQKPGPKPGSRQGGRRGEELIRRQERFLSAIRFGMTLDEARLDAGIAINAHRQWLASDSEYEARFLSVYNESSSLRYEVTRKRISASSSRVLKELWQRDPDAVMRRLSSNKRLTATEQIVADVLRESGIEFTPHFIAYRKEFDIYVPSHRLDVEVDGRRHNSPENRRKDEARDELLRSHGYSVLRLSTREVEDDTFLPKLRTALNLPEKA